ncbi:hypothetical protein COT42_00680 [Candidatus Saganbacteria bacterium CG08_land_8_20_14_0_20_45_16]|uniref:AAA+ ATPase domain-containing protein n=1 Tax=Candidatus Saganbacteria bacterium CG08_land_8_20_14_0_20_45_16 TaxID=2014293 RepID=A0A2H0Y1P7_UNCSA|nr:MAG: hypothetical protein COT42_00680 [Candidatus Saganbacteria bacterium CG08_land_8_20_14_0_20_45_16]
MLINRALLDKISEYLEKEPKIIVLYGPRQAGKTTLINELFKNYGDKVLFFNGDDLRAQELLGEPNLDKLKAAVGSSKIICIDEAQRIPNIGLSLKLLFDALQIRVVASGSSSFELSNKINEPLTGRLVTFHLYQICVKELTPASPDLSLAPRLEEFLRFGLYPKVLTTEGEEEKQRYLFDLVNTYLYKDILSFETIRKPKKVIDLLSLLALQIGSEVSISELAKHLALSRPIVEKYLDILEKMFVIFNLRGFSRNLRKEIYKTSKYYFTDLGLRNALIRNFNPLALRPDAGALFENFCVMERIKTINNAGKFANFYFWRTYDQKEIDFIEERDGQLFGYECKWSDKTRAIPASFHEFSAAYPNSTLTFVGPGDFESLNQL